MNFEKSRGATTRELLINERWAISPRLLHGPRISRGLDRCHEQTCHYLQSGRSYHFALRVKVGTKWGLKGPLKFKTLLERPGKIDLPPHPWEGRVPPQHLGRFEGSLAHCLKQAPLT